MSGDVQPRKRKDKKKKKDELGLEEPRGTAAALGEGDVFIHSYSDHGTGGHWCAKIIFFSLLAVLVTLIGLIILENRGLSELEANSVESQYSNLLEGWLEDAPDDDHHDEHTLELKHHDDDEEDDHYDSHDVGDDEEEHPDEDEEHTDDDEDKDEHGDDDDDDHADEDENEGEQADEDEETQEDEDQNDGEDSQQDLEEADEDEDERSPYQYYSQENEDEEESRKDDDEDEQDNAQDEDDEQEQGEDEEENNDENESIEELDNDVEDSQGRDVEAGEDEGFNENEENDEEDEDEHDDHEDEDDELEVEKIEQEASEEEPISLGLPALPEDDDDDDNKDKDDDHDDDDDDADDADDEADGEVDADDDFLEADDVPPVVERVSAPAGKPFKEVDEDDDSTEKPPDTLEEEEEYEKQQEEKRKEEEQSSHHKDGGNSVEEMWAGEPADAYWRQQLDSAERDLRQGAWSLAVERASAAELRNSARARYVIAVALDRLAEARRDNGLLSRAIAAYFDLLEMNERLGDKKLVEIARRTLDRIQFRGNYLKAEPVYRILIRRYPDEPAYRNNLTVSFLMAGRNDLAENSLKETLARWPDDRVALVHYAFILKTAHKDRLEEAVELFQKALEGDKGPACEPRFYYHYGDALLLLGRLKEAREVHERGAKLGHFLSAAQRSLYNVPRLKSRPWWNVNETPYAALAKNLEKRWKEILKEGQKAKALFEKEKEGLKERGEWSQMDLFVRGQEMPGRCAVAPVTCAVVRGERGAAGCRRGQVKFSSMAAGTHVRPHVGPTNCRLRMHLGLSNTKDTFLRVDKETRQWQEGKVLLFDDSFEHEVWHNGTSERLVLIVDVWHPDLSDVERRHLPPI